MAEGPEAKIVNKIIKKVNELPMCKVEKNHGSQWGKPKLDLTGSVHGMMFQLEVKVPGKKPTPRQMSTIRSWQAVGVHAGWTDSVEDGLNFVKLLLKRRKDDQGERSEQTKSRGAAEGDGRDDQVLAG